MTYEIRPLNPNGPGRSVREKVMHRLTRAQASQARAAA